MKRLLIVITIIGLLASLSCAAYAAPASIEIAEGPTGYQYGVDNFIGLDFPGNLEVDYSTMEGKTINGVSPGDNWYLRYEDLLLFDKYVGSFSVYPSADGTIYSMAFGLDGPLNCSEIIDQISAILGQPVHKENYNDKRYPAAHFLWFLDDVHYYHFGYDTKDGSGSLGLGKLTEEEISMRERCFAALAADDSLRTTYNNINEHQRYIGLCIEEAIKERGAVYDRSEVKKVVFTEPGELFGFSGHYEYVVDNPNGDMLDYRTRFVGEIIELDFLFDNVTESEVQEIAEKLERMYGEYKGSDYYSWESSLVDCTLYIDYTNVFGGPTLAFMDSMPSYYIDPTVANTDSIEEFSANKSCDWELLNVDSVEYSKQIQPYYDSFDICLELAQSAILKQLKSPSTASFGGEEDTTIWRDGNTYSVSSWVDAQNSFGAMLRANYLVHIDRQIGTLPDDPTGFTVSFATIFE